MARRSAPPLRAQTIVSPAAVEHAVPTAVGEMKTPTLWTSGFALCRKGALTFAALSQLSQSHTGALLEQAAQLRATRGAEREQLLGLLYQLASAVTPEQRNLLIELQRDVYNDRTPTPTALTFAAQALGGSAAELSAWLSSRADEEELLRSAETVAGEELDEAHRALIRLASREEVRQGLLLANRRVYGEVRRLVHHAAAKASDKRTRHTEATLVSFLYRMALKTSPFGAFTELSLKLRGALDERDTLVVNETRARRMVRLSRAFLQWMAEELPRQLTECWDDLPHFLANTAQEGSEKIHFFVPGSFGATDETGGDRFVRLSLTPPVRALLSTVADGPQPRGRLANQLMASGVPEGSARTMIDRLVEVGLLERSLGLAEQDPEYTRHLADAVAALPGERALRCARVLRRLDDIERALPEAAASQREAELERVHELVQEFADILGIPRLSEEQSRSYVFEDVARQQPLTAWDEELFTGQRTQFATLQRLLPLFDDVALEQSGLYDLFTRHYGPAGRCEDLPTFYQLFANQGPVAISALMTGVDLPLAAQLQQFRQQFYAHLGDRLKNLTPGQSVLQLDESWVEDLVAKFPESLPPWSSAAYALQFFQRSASGPGIVVNNVVNGYGWAYSRFCALFADIAGVPSPALQDRVAAQIRERELRERQVDITAVFGMNTNLHPRLTDLELVYPRCRGYGPRESMLTLRDIILIGDEQRRRIVPISRRDGQPLRLFAHNFLFPAAGPNLYRFLCALTPLINYRGGLWTKYLRETESADVPQLPRLQLGRLVLDRRTWVWPVALLPSVEPSKRNGLASIMAAQRWQQRLGLPREGFFRFLPAHRSSPTPTEWADEMRSWAIAARSVRQRKPYYLDFHNPLLCSALFKQLQESNEGFLMFQECLPSTEEYTAPASASSAEEYIIEIDLR